MPSNFLNADISFPQLADEQSSEEKFRIIQNYLYMLLEQLRYSMSNLGEDNFNDTELKNIAGIITAPVYVQLQDDEGNISALQLTAEGLGTRMTSAEGGISSLTQTADSLQTRVSTAEGGISTLTQSASGLQTRVEAAEGSISTLTQNANALTARVTDAETGLSSTLRLSANGLQITNANGDAVTIDGGQINADSLNLTGSINIANKFIVNHDGTMIWAASNSPVAVQYSANGSTNWHTTYSTSDYYARYSYDGGQTWTTAIRIQGRNGYDGSDGSDANVPSYIKSTYIGSTKIVSPEIYAAEFYATGQGRLGQPAYYIYDGCSVSGGSVTLGEEIGFLSYDDNGAGTSNEAAERVFLTTLGGVALKIQSSGNMSISAQDFIYFGSEIRAYNGIRLGSASYGSTLPSVGAAGQLFFKTS